METVIYVNGLGRHPDSRMLAGVRYFADEEKCVILYDEDKRKEAIELAKSKRSEGIKTVMINKSSADDLEYLGSKLEVIEL